MHIVVVVVLVFFFHSFVNICCSPVVAFGCFVFDSVCVVQIGGLLSLAAAVVAAQIVGQHRVLLYNVKLY